MKKRITNKELKAQVAKLVEENEFYASVIRLRDEDMRQAQHKIKRLERIAEVDVRQVPPHQDYEICMRVDPHSWHRGGSRLLKENVLNMFQTMHTNLAADALPAIEWIEQNADIQKFLAEWLRITVGGSTKRGMFVIANLSFWMEVVKRLLDAIKALKDAGKNNYEAREKILHHAFRNPIPD